MQKIIVCCSFILVCTFSQNGMSLTCGATAVMTTTTEAGEKIELTLDSALVDKSPKWNINVGEPPLALSKAIQSAINWGALHHGRYDRLEIGRMVLSSSSCAGSGDHWYYVFEFVPIIENRRAFVSGLWIAILMDGTIVETKAK